MGILSKLFPACCSPSSLAEQRRQSQRISDVSSEAYFDEKLERGKGMITQYKEKIRGFCIACNQVAQSIEGVEANAVTLRREVRDDYEEAQDILELIIDIEKAAKPGYQAGYQVGGSMDVSPIVEYKQNVERLAKEFTLAGLLARYYMTEVNSALFEQSASASRGFCCC